MGFKIFRPAAKIFLKRRMYFLLRAAKTIYYIEKITGRKGRKTRKQWKKVKTRGKSKWKNIEPLLYGYQLKNIIRREQKIDKGEDITFREDAKKEEVKKRFIEVEKAGAGIKKGLSSWEEAREAGVEIEGWIEKELIKEHEKKEKEQTQEQKWEKRNIKKPSEKPEKIVQGKAMSYEKEEEEKLIKYLVEAGWVVDENAPLITWIRWYFKHGRFLESRTWQDADERTQWIGVQWERFINLIYKAYQKAMIPQSQKKYPFGSKFIHR